MTEPRLNGLIVTYRDDQIDESVRLALKGKSRVRYKCMDTFSHFLAFGTTSGAVYLYRLNSVTRSTCSLLSMIPCDQGSIEVIKFLAGLQADDLLIAIGTSRGSIVILRLFQAPREQTAYCDEIYKAECFTNNSSIRLIESDQDLLDPASQFSRLYICDSADRLYVLESTSIYSNKNGLRLFRQSHLPSLIFSVNDSHINQISVHRSNLLISTDETTRLFNEQSNKLNVIGKKKRKLGYYGACFFNPDYKPTVSFQHESRKTSYSSLASLNDFDNLLIFVARPMFRMWQVNYRGDVMLTHQFEQSLKAFSFPRIVELNNVPLEENMIDDPEDVMKCFHYEEDNNETKQQVSLKSDHFHKLIQIYSSTLGNLLLSYSQHELFIIDPIGAEIITWCSFEDLIVQVCCSENDIFIWFQAIENEQKRFHLKRFLLLAPTQLVLELHRIHRYLSLVMFVQQFSQLFRDKMVLPISGPNIITTEGGLLRNILLNAWDVVSQWQNNESHMELLSDVDTYCATFKQLVEEIIDESKQLKNSLDNLTDSRFFLAMANENIDRLLSEPYASLVSLEVSIAELHTSHVIHFSKEAINRHKSVANLYQDLRAAVHEAKQQTKSSLNLSINDCNANNMPSKSMRDLTGNSFRAKKAQVIVDRQRPRRNSSQIFSNRFYRVAEDKVENETRETDNSKAPNFFSVRSAQENLECINETIDDNNLEAGDDQKNEPCDDLVAEEQVDEKEDEKKLQMLRCGNCGWPKTGSHLKPMNRTQEIQLKWIEDNLTTNFFENIDSIAERAFRYSLWALFLRCLAFKRQLDDYITCCMLLDDVRLLDIEQLVIICSGEDEMINLLLSHLNRKIEIQGKSQNEGKGYCWKCETEYELSKSVNDTDRLIDDRENQLAPESLPISEGDDFSFSLANVFNQFISRSNSNIKKLVHHFLDYDKLLMNSKIPIGLYLKAIENTINRSKRIKRNPQISQGLPFWSSDNAL